MARWAACLREHRRTCEGCRDLHQTRSVLAAVSGRDRGLGEREPPSFGPMQEDPRICFETFEDGQEPRGNHAWETTLVASQNIVVRCNIARPRDGVKNRAYVDPAGAVIPGPNDVGQSLAILVPRTQPSFDNGPEFVYNTIRPHASLGYKPPAPVRGR